MVWFYFLEDMDLLDRNNIPILKKQQVVKDYKKSANPAFSGKDWEIFKETLNRYEYLNEGWTDDMEEKEKWSESSASAPLPRPRSCCRPHLCCRAAAPSRHAACS